MEINAKSGIPVVVWTRPEHYAHVRPDDGKRTREIVISAVRIRMVRYWRFNSHQVDAVARTRIENWWLEVYVDRIDDRILTRPALEIVDKKAIVGIAVDNGIIYAFNNLRSGIPGS